MTKPRDVNDPTFGGQLKDSRPSQSRSYGAWMLGGLVALAVVLGVLFMLPHDNDRAAMDGRSDSSPTSTSGSGANEAAKPATAPRPAAMH